MILYLLKYLFLNLYITVVSLKRCSSMYLCTWSCLLQNHWFTYNENMSVESVTQAVSHLALAFGDDDADPGAMVSDHVIVW